MVAVMRKALEIAKAWPGGGLGEPVIPPHLAQAHGHHSGAEPSDALLEDVARHYALTVYHETSTCRIGEKAAELIAADHGVHLHEAVGRGLGQLASVTCNLGERRRCRILSRDRNGLGHQPGEQPVGVLPGDGFHA